MLTSAAESGAKSLEIAISSRLGGLFLWNHKKKHSCKTIAS